MNAQAEWEEIVRHLAGELRPGCTPRRTTTRVLIPRNRRAVPVVPAATQSEVTA